MPAFLVTVYDGKYLGGANGSQNEQISRLDLTTTPIFSYKVMIGFAERQ